ncbi:hypothetical protein LP420_24520 [Massilia sp. B-10]|nr:hypothetical protein LP420_24520 [Massilia sp. B-10]
MLAGACSIQTTKMVIGTSVANGSAADDNGVITIVGDHTNLKGDTTATARNVSIIPYIGATALAPATDGGKTITEWKCGPGTANPMPLKYLPGSCKSTT